MLFSERIGKKPIRTELLTENVTPELANALWSAFLEYGYDVLEDFKYDSLNNPRHYLTPFCKSLWVDFFKRPVDNMSHWRNSGAELYANREGVRMEIRNWFFSSKIEWHEQLSFVEFCAKNLPFGTAFIATCNYYLTREVSAYRIVEKEVVQITDKGEIEEIKQALNTSDKFLAAKTHLQAALQLLSDRKNPDYRNSIKESISAVEALCKIITGNKNTTLGDALKVVEKKYPLHESLKKAFSALYGFTSDSGGIRHSLKDEVSDLKFEDAKFMLVSCSAFVNYLIAKTT